jgi:hypothetical protein
MLVKIDSIKRHTEKATLFIKDDYSAWIPKSCYQFYNSENQIKVKDDFEVNWKKEVTYSAKDKIIVLTEDNINDLWEYI